MLVDFNTQANFLQNAKFFSGVYDTNNYLGSAGQVLTSTGTAVQWGTVASSGIFYFNSNGAITSTGYFLPGSGQTATNTFNATIIIPTNLTITNITGLLFSSSTVTFTLYKNAVLCANFNNNKCYSRDNNCLC